MVSELGIGPNILFGMLREKNILRNDNMPGQPYREKGYLTIEPKLYTFSTGYSVLCPKTRITEKGMAYFKKIFREIGTA